MLSSHIFCYYWNKLQFINPSSNFEKDENRMLLRMIYDKADYFCIAIIFFSSCDIEFNVKLWEGGKDKKHRSFFI